MEAVQLTKRFHTLSHTLQRPGDCYFQFTGKEMEAQRNAPATTQMTTLSDLPNVLVNQELVNSFTDAL